eukprot:1477976-Rhodomonas_salina.1
MAVRNETCSSRMAVQNETGAVFRLRQLRSGFLRVYPGFRLGLADIRLRLPQTTAKASVDPRTALRV